jgi:hypothetical protein
LREALESSSNLKRYEVLEQEYEEKLAKDPRSISALSGYARLLFTTSKLVQKPSYFLIFYHSHGASTHSARTRPK